MFYRNSEIQSVISDGCDLRTAFSRVLNYFDPNKSRNRKTRVLDCSYSHMWTENDMKMFKIQKTNNTRGSVKDKTFDIIFYEPPRNQNFYKHSINSSKTFNKVINPKGTVIVKMNDFKEKGKNELRGSFEIWDTFSDAGLYLYDNIVYKFNKPSNDDLKVYDRAKIIHLYFMIFKKKE
jgi:hypothetical protein